MGHCCQILDDQLSYIDQLCCILPSADQAVQWDAVFVWNETKEELMIERGKL
jgi:hypothetical protein